MNSAVRKAEIRSAMEAVRTKTLRLMECVPDEFLKVRVHDFYSPVGWHFGHIGMTEEYWVINQALHRPCRDQSLTFLFANLAENPKDNRIHLPSREVIHHYLADTRCTVLAALEEADFESQYPLLTDGYAWEFALQHECQHQETITEMLQLIQKERVAYDSLFSLEPASPNTPMLTLPGGTFCMGSNYRHGYDNEKEAHRVHVAPFSIDITPVTAGQWATFINDGGYERPELWKGEGWGRRLYEATGRPEYWLRGQTSDTFGYSGAQGLRPLRQDEPVTSLSWYEADAYARWVGKRLPTEAEWEYAARFDPQTGESRCFPWGEEPPTEVKSSFGLREWEPGPVGAHPKGASAFGVLDMAGGVWEWTATPFLPYPGFRAYPYDGYSKDHMDGKHYICRGGSWASDGRILRCSFRNWYVPTYRQGFLGLRCAR